MIVAENADWIVSTDFGNSLIEGSVSTGEQGLGGSFSITVEQRSHQLNSMFGRIEPVSGSYGDFWDTFWSNHVGGEPADEFAMGDFFSFSSGLSYSNSYSLNADNFDENDEEFRFSLYESSLDAARGFAPVISFTFTIVDDDPNHEPTGQPVLDGSAIEGEVLTADPSGIFDEDGIPSNVFYYQWLRDGDAIPDAVQENYTLVQEDVGHAISVVVSYTDGFGAEESLTSAATDDIEASTIHLVGTDVNESLQGAETDDTLEGAGGNDFLEGAAGNDLLEGGLGNDTLIGGEGNDTLIGGEGESDLRDVMYGGAGDDNMNGGYGNDELRGDAGNDSIAGGFGADTVIGGTGNDTLTGSAFSDQIFGGDGDDFVNGGWGHDRVNGGEGADQFFHIGIFNHGSDWIQDYAAADGDVLMFGNTDATRSQFQINAAHRTSADGERAGDDTVAEAFVIYRPTGQIMWALVDGMGQDSIQIQIGEQVFDLMA